MKIYSDVLSLADILKSTEQVDGLYIDEIKKIEKPKLRERGWILRTASTTGNRWRNNGKRGADGLRAATRDDHGYWFAHLYAMDPNAKICEYNNAREFHMKTEDRYQIVR